MNDCDNVGVCAYSITIDLTTTATICFIIIIIIFKNSLKKNQTY